jgi:hypothetical protein
MLCQFRSKYIGLALGPFLLGDFLLLYIQLRRDLIKVLEQLLSVTPDATTLYD